MRAFHPKPLGQDRNCGLCGGGDLEGVETIGRGSLRNESTRARLHWARYIVLCRPAAKSVELWAGIKTTKPFNVRPGGSLWDEEIARCDWEGGCTILSGQLYLQMQDVVGWPQGGVRDHDVSPHVDRLWRLSTVTQIIFNYQAGLSEPPQLMSWSVQRIYKLLTYGTQPTFVHCLVELTKYKTPIVFVQTL